MRTKTLFSTIMLPALSLVMLLCSSVSANDTATITIHAGNRKVFQGFGASSTNMRDYQQLPTAVRDTLSSLVWRDANFRYLRVWARMGENADSYFMSRYSMYLADAKAKQPNLSLLLAPDFRRNPIYDTLDTAEKVYQYARFFAQLISDLKTKHGVTFEATGVLNEPDHHNFLRADKMAMIVRFFRQELDSRGLTDVKIIAPETSNVDSKAREMVDSIIADGEALAGLGGFATHSYNMCLTRQMRDKVYPYDKEYWQTESAEQSKEDFNDPMRAVYCASRFLSDINLGVTHWFWFIAYGPFHQYNNSSKLIGFDTQSGQWRTFLRYHYFKQLSEDFRPGNQMRFATSSLSYQKDLDRTNGEKDRFRDMENTGGLKPHLCAAAGVNTDSTWSIGIANQTGIPSDWDKAQWGADRVYDVTLVVEELVDSPDVDFVVRRSRRVSQGEVIDTVTMIAGKTMVTLRPFDLLTLRSLSTFSDDIKHERFTRRLQGPLSMNPAMIAGNAAVSVRITMGDNAFSPVSLGVYDIQGRLVRTLIDSWMTAGTRAVSWDGTGDNGAPLPTGMYVLRLSSSDMNATKRISISR